LEEEFNDVRFEVSTAVTMMIIIFWEMIVIDFNDDSALQWDLIMTEPIITDVAYKGQLKKL
jgi:hypothetical protein